ncbi:MAG: aspartate kinase [Planctomycetota bacterium]|jgi:aspartate kinase
MDLCVSKFGGAALEDGAAVRRVADLVRGRTGQRQVLVVSAHRGVTQQLSAACDAARSGTLSWDALRVRHRTILRQLELPSDLLTRHLQSLRGLLAHLAGTGFVDARQRDHVLSFGERMSARVVAAHLRASGVPATAIDAYDLGLVHHPDLGFLPPAEEEERNRLRERLLGVVGVPVVTGFLALNSGGDLTTLGPNGSDLTATWLAEALGAQEVLLWKPVSGIYSADPKLVPEARLLEEIGWDDAAVLALQGAAILHPAAGAPARRASIPVRVRSVLEPSQTGTLVSDEVASEVGVIAIAHRRNVALVELKIGGNDGQSVATEAQAREKLEALGLSLETHGVEPLSMHSTPSSAFLLMPESPALAPAAGELIRAGATLHRGLSALSPVGRGVEVDGEVDRALGEICGPDAILLPPRPGSRARIVLVRQEALKSTAVRLHERLLGCLTC